MARLPKKKRYGLASCAFCSASYEKQSPTQKLCGAQACARGYRNVRRIGYVEEGVHSAWADLIEGDGLSAEGRRKYDRLVAEVTAQGHEVDPMHNERSPFGKALDVR